MSTKIPEELEERLAYLESEVAKLKTKAESDSLPVPWWEKIAENPAYDEAMELDREYRESLRPKTIEKFE
jgi:hypothetical protein